MWTQGLPKGFIKRGLFPKFDLGHWEKVVWESDDGLSVGRLQELAQKIWMPVTNLTSAEADFYCLNDHGNPRLLSKAGCRMPWEEESIYLNGDPVCDGGLVCPLPVFFAFEAGADQVWVISPYPEGNTVNPTQRLIASYLLGRCKVTRKLIRNSAENENELRNRFKLDERIRFIRPIQALPIHWRSTNPISIAQSIELGKRAGRDFLTHQKL